MGKPRKTIKKITMNVLEINELEKCMHIAFD